MARQIEIKLGGRTFVVSQLAIRADANWRDSVRDMIEPLSELAISSGLNAPTPERLTRLAFTSSLFIDPGRMLDAILAYSPDLRAEQKWIEENAYAEDALTALLTLFFGAMPMASGAAPRPAATT